MNRNVLYLITDALAAVAAVAGYLLYQERRKTTGIEINMASAAFPSKRSNFRDWPQKDHWPAERSLFCVEALSIAGPKRMKPYNEEWWCPSNASRIESNKQVASNRFSIIGIPAAAACLRIFSSG